MEIIIVCLSTAQPLTLQNMYSKIKQPEDFYCTSALCLALCNEDREVCHSGSCFEVLRKQVTRVGEDVLRMAGTLADS